MRTGLLFTVLLGLTGCGFQPRGQATLPPTLHTVYLQAAPGALQRALRTALTRSGATMATTPAEATATLILLNEGPQRRTMAADKFDVKRQYRTTYTAKYQLVLPNGPVSTIQEVSTTRNLVYDERRVLGFDASQTALNDSMAEELAWQIIRRLQATLL